MIGSEWNDKHATKKRGKYTKKFINHYCVLDLETTGLSWKEDQIIEIGILKIRNNKIVQQYSQLINPKQKISLFITHLTGITNEMIINAPYLEDIKKDIIEFIGQDTIVGHNTSFDLNFLANGLNIDIHNEYVDTLYLSRKAYPQLKHHRLSDMVQFLHLSQNEHRALADCIATYELYEHIKRKEEA